MLPRTAQTAGLALLLGAGIAVPAAFADPAASSSQFEQRSVTIGTVTYTLPDNWVFINTKCKEGDKDYKDCQKKASDFLAKYKDSKGNNYSFLNNQNWLQCLSDCPGGSSSSGVDLDYCMGSPDCMKDIQGTLAAAQATAAKSADPQKAPEVGDATGQLQAARFLENPNQVSILSEDMHSNPPPSGPGPARSTSQKTPSQPPGQKKDAGGLVVSQGGPLGGGGPSNPSDSSNPSDGTMGPGGDLAGSGAAQDNPGLNYLRGGFSGNPNSGMSGLTDTIVKSSPFLNDHMSFYLASNNTPTNLRALERVGSDVLNPIARQVLGDSASGRDGASGRTAFDGQSSNLPKDAKPKCSTNFFGQSNCPK
ncbi:MAG: hypothetical protein NTY77_02370 [Elusimicrobia bacterium]|nr:hypothetical protein [Elusimicrobiota bacterium]